MFYALWNTYDKVERTSQVNSHWYFLFHSSQTDIGIGQEILVIGMINKYQTGADVRPASAALKGLGHEINILFECLMRRWFFKSVDASILEKSKSKFLLQWNYLLILKNLFSNPLAPQFLLWKCKKTAFDPEKPYRKTTVTGKFGTISLHQIRNEHWRSKTITKEGFF